jgi:predicted ABC-type ATPase
MPRPVLFVLAGVNGAGKSSIGGHLLERQRLTWFNPDTFARELVATSGCDQATANAHAWNESVRRLDKAIAQGHSHAFETTLGGRTVAARIAAAARTHDVMMWFCGLASPDLHVARVRARVAAGGHDIPEARIRERYPQAMQNLITLMPCLAHLQVYDNTVEADVGSAIPDPVLVLEMRNGGLVWPAANDGGALQRTAEWAKPLMEAALMA